MAEQIYVYTASTTTIFNLGYDWIPFLLLTLPWCRGGILFVVFGALINALLLYGTGKRMQFIWHRSRCHKQPM